MIEATVLEGIGPAGAGRQGLTVQQGDTNEHILFFCQDIALSVLELTLYVDQADLKARIPPPSFHTFNLRTF